MRRLPERIIHIRADSGGGAIGQAASKALNGPSVSESPPSENQATAGEQVTGAIINISNARNGGLGDYSVGVDTIVSADTLNKVPGTQY
jgi:hypothetical protein